MKWRFINNMDKYCTKDNINVFNGEALNVMDYLIEEGVKVDAIITDPPYGATAAHWDKVLPFNKLWVRLNKLIKKNGAIILFGIEPFSSYLRMSNIKNYKYDWIWQKGRATGFLNANKQPLRSFELISVFYGSQSIYNPQMRTGFKAYKTTSKNSTSLYGDYKPHSTQSKNGERFPLNIIKFKYDKERYHPTQKPVKLMEYLIKTYTNKGEIILDFTAGSFSTGVAAVNIERKFIGIEIDKEYFDIGVKRMSEASKTLIKVNKVRSNNISSFL